MTRTAFTAAGVLTGFVLAGSSVLTAEAAGPAGAKSPARPGPVVTTYAEGLTNPRGLTFGPDGHLYVAEAGTGGDDVATDEPGCEAEFNVYSPYFAGDTGRVTRVLADGTMQTVAANLPSTSDSGGSSFGPTDVAFIGDQLYVLIEMGGCQHGLPDDLPAILRVNKDGSTTNVANLSAWLAANQPNFVKEEPIEITDQEPGGVFHSMIAQGKYLYVVETNRGFVLRFDPKSGIVEKLYDMSIDSKEHNPIVMARRGNEFHVGTFGEDGGPAELAVFDKHFAGYSLPFESLNPIVGLAWRGSKLFGVEIFPLDVAWLPDSKANLVAFDPKTGERTEVLTGFASYPNGLVTGPDGALYTSNWAVGGPGGGSILRIVP
jgi:hypothetical protein